MLKVPYAKTNKKINTSKNKLKNNAQITFFWYYCCGCGCGGFL